MTLPFLPAAVAVLAVLGACAPVADPDNIEPADQGGAYQAQYRDPPRVTREAAPSLMSPLMNAGKCLPPRGGAVSADAIGSGKGVLQAAQALRGERLSRGDLLDVRVASDETLSGTFEISRDGSIRLPFLGPVRAEGRSVDAVEADLVAALQAEGLYDGAPRVSVRLMDMAGVSVGVTGAVFEARPVQIGRLRGDDRDAMRQSALGASNEARDLASALRSAGGIRPDADLSAVELRRGGQVHVLDLREVMEGRDRADIMLIGGDEIHVPSRQCFQDDLMKPSPISPAGITLFLSNLTQPSSGNASSAIGKDVREVPYGTRFLQAVIDTNCVGGGRATSSWRAAALVSRNPTSGVSVVVERDLEGMLRRADRDDFDPYLLPGDAIACYDSTLNSAADLGLLLGRIAGALP